MPQLCQNDSERALGMDQYGMTYQAVADHFNVSRIIIPRLNMIRRRQTGRTNDRPRNERPRGSVPDANKVTVFLDLSHCYRNSTVIITIWLTRTKYPHCKWKWMFFFPLSPSRLLPDLTTWVILWMSSSGVVFCQMFPVSLDCPFVIALSGFSIVFAHLNFSLSYSLTLSLSFLFYFGNVPTVWYYLLLIFYRYIYNLLF
jgi:hypothetical protein